MEFSNALNLTWRQSGSVQTSHIPISSERHPLDFGHFSRYRDRTPRPVKPLDDDDCGEDEGPRSPKVERPGTDDILKRMRRVDPRQARRYRQRTGE